MEENLPRFNRIYYKGFFVENFKKNSNTDNSDLTVVRTGVRPPASIGRGTIILLIMEFDLEINFRIFKKN